MMTAAIRVAKYLKDEKYLYGDMHLQKVLYYAQAWSLAWTGKPLFTDEIEAWANGPVVRRVWVAEKSGDLALEAGDLTSSEKMIVDAVYDHYGSVGGNYLSGLTHSELPWKEARGDVPAGARSTNAISQATMRRYYTKQALEGGSRKLPVAPVIPVSAPDEVVREIGKRQSFRWRDALDQLATQ